MDIMQIGLSGLMASKIAMNTHSENVANADTEGYTRKTGGTVNSTPVPDGRGFYNSGAQYEDTTARIDSYSLRTLSTSTAEVAFNEENLGIASTMSSMLGNLSEKAQSATSKLSESVQDFMANPTDTNAQLSVSSFKDLSETLNSGISAMNDFLSGEKNSLNTMISELNSHLTALAKINEGISSNGTPSSEMLDTRDREIKSIAEMTGASPLILQNGTVEMLANGQPLVLPSGAAQVSIKTGSFLGDISFVANGTSIQFAGRIGGATQAIKDGENAANSFSDAAASLLYSIGEQFKLGTDKNGNNGTSPISLSTSAIGNWKNTGTATLDVSGQVKTGTFRYSSSGWEFDGGNGFSSVPATMATNISGTPNIGDTFKVEARNAFPTTISATTFPGGGTPYVGTNDTTNAKKINDVILNSGFTDAIATTNSKYASDVSARGMQLSASQQMNSSLMQSLDRFSVNLDEEAAGLLLQQQIYQASSKVIATAQSLFSTFLDAIN